MTLLTVEQLGQLLDRTEHDLFRIETLPLYDTDMTTGDYRRWLDGEPEPTWEVRQPWLDTLARWAREGRPRRRVRIIHAPIGSYELYACQWGYRYNVEAGEPTRIIDLSEQSLPRELNDAPGDWWLIDGATVVLMHYNPAGQFQGAEALDPNSSAPYIVAADTAWRVAEPFHDWWTRHPQHHRTPTTVA